MGHMSPRDVIKLMDSVKSTRGGSKKNLHCWDVFTREGICGVTDEQTCFTYSPARESEFTENKSEHTYTLYSKNDLFILIDPWPKATLL